MCEPGQDGRDVSAGPKGAEGIIGSYSSLCVRIAHVGIRRQSGI